LLGTDQVSEEQRKEYTKGIEDTAARLSSLISNILKLNKLEHQRITPETADYDVCRQLCESIFLFEDAMEEKEIELEADIEDAAMIKADESLIELVWNNLLSNAVKFTERGGSITIRQTSDEDHIRVRISDTGCGISKESINHIFDKFYQGDTSHSTQGNGLGLALVKRVLELMDGEIQITSEEGKGSTFLVTLPAAGAES
ncbi:MAG: HAMP domain-containing histidine kinase, partial [Acetatifactor sp.]|nr:HAMP domain-containing histidine kinase [Acetatifactor sp.]